MHELLAPIFYAVDFDSLDTSPSSTSNLELAELCDRQWIAADAWALFIAVMANASEWYEWREPAVSAPANGQVEIKAYIAPIVGVCNRIHGDFLRVVDPLLYSKLQESDIEPQIYGMWVEILRLRLLSDAH
jgi:TBC1 domain family protein 5